MFYWRLLYYHKLCTTLLARVSVRKQGQNKALEEPCLHYTTDRKNAHIHTNNTGTKSSYSSTELYI